MLFRSFKFNNVLADAMGCWLDPERIECRPSLPSTVVVLTEIIFTQVIVDLNSILCIESIRMVTKINVEGVKLMRCT